MFNLKKIRTTVTQLLQKMYSADYITAGAKTYKRISSFGIKFEREYDAITSIEIHIVQHCNLNCRSCTHFSPLAEPEFASLEEFENNIKRLAKVTRRRVRTFHVMGGEPLLHIDCVKFLEVTRKYFPDSVVQLVTNGILLPQQGEDFYYSLSKNNIIISPTKYPIEIDWDKILANCNKYCVKLEFFNPLDEVKTLLIRPLDLDGMQDPKKSFGSCTEGGLCNQLVGEKLYPCAYAAYIRHFSKYFDQALCAEEGDYVDIYHVKNLKEILMALSKPIPFCRYCKVDKIKQGFKWRISEKNIEEWV